MRRFVFPEAKAIVLDASFTWLFTGNSVDDFTLLESEFAPTDNGSFEDNTDIFPGAGPQAGAGEGRIRRFVFVESLSGTFFFRATNKVGVAVGCAERDGNASSYVGSLLLVAPLAAPDSRNGRHASRMPLRIENEALTRRAQRRLGPVWHDNRCVSSAASVDSQVTRACVRSSELSTDRMACTVPNSLQGHSITELPFLCD